MSIDPESATRVRSSEHRFRPLAVRALGGSQQAIARLLLIRFGKQLPKQITENEMLDHKASLGTATE